MFVILKALALALLLTASAAHGGASVEMTQASAPALHQAASTAMEGTTASCPSGHCNTSGLSGCPAGLGFCGPVIFPAVPAVTRLAIASDAATFAEMPRLATHPAAGDPPPPRAPHRQG